jgi:SSS family solute:Na+ symporter
MNAARLTPVVAAYPKLFIPIVTVIPGAYSRSSTRRCSPRSPDAH